jgi:hypothetical protein
MFGGSTLWGFGSPDWETIPSHLAKRFSSEGRPACVINMAGDAWRSDEAVIKLIQQLNRPNARLPHHVLFLDSCNDVLVPFLYTGAVDLPWHFNKEWFDASLKIALSQGSFDYVKGTNTWILMRRIIRRGATGRLRPLTSDPERLAREVVDRYIQNIRIIDGLSRSYGFRYAFFWLPLSTDAPEPFLMPIEKTMPLVRAAAAGRFHDLNDAFGDRPRDFSVDICHFLPEGNRLVADRVYEAIK